MDLSKFVSDFEVIFSGLYKFTILIFVVTQTFCHSVVIISVRDDGFGLSQLCVM